MYLGCVMPKINTIYTSSYENNDSLEKFLLLDSQETPVE